MDGSFAEHSPPRQLQRAQMVADDGLHQTLRVRGKAQAAQCIGRHGCANALVGDEAHPPPVIDGGRVWLAHVVQQSRQRQEQPAAVPAGEHDRQVVGDLVGKRYVGMRGGTVEGQ